MGHHNHFVFTGDARIRQLYKSFISQFIVDGKASDLIDLPQNSDLNFNDAQLRLNVQFLQRPQLDNFMIDDLRSWMVTHMHISYTDSYKSFNKNLMWVLITVIFLEK